MKLDMGRFLELFFEESRDHLATLEEGLLALEGGGGTEVLADVFRAAHSLKGASGAVGLGEVAALTHAMEGLLDRLREGTLAPEPARVDLLLRATDLLSGLIESARAGEDVEGRSEGLRKALLAELGTEEKTAVAAGPADSGAAATRWRVRFEPAEETFACGLDPLLLMRDLAALGTVERLEVHTGALPALDELDPLTSHLAWTVELETGRPASELQEIFEFAPTGSRLELEPLAEDGDRKARGPSVHRDGGSIRVATEKVDGLVDLVGELVIAQSMVSQVSRDFTPDKLFLLQESVAALERHVRDLQERVLGIRMVPVGSLFGRLPRLVRDLAAGLGKQVELELAGEDTELDKGVVEHLGDPLTHLVRNAVDHGLEPPEARAAAGKPETGVLRIEAFHEGGNVVIEVADDGRGLDTARILRRAVERGLVSETEQPTDEQIHALILQPGFSTAETVSDVSGRGVGMDVVKSNIEALNGSLAIHSTPGGGTRFRVTLPLTLAILDGLQLRVGEEAYVLPLVTVVESLRPRPEQVKTVLGRGELVVMRGESLPIVRLHRLFGSGRPDADPTDSLVVVVENDGRRVGLLVDAIDGQSQVVVKSLESNFRRVEGVMGATILGDGHVALILDVPGLVRLGFAALGPSSFTAGPAGVAATGALQ